MRSILADGLYEYMIIKAFGDFSGSLFLLFSYGVCVNDTKMILFVENSVRKRLFSTENDGIIIGE